MRSPPKALVRASTVRALGPLAERRFRERPRVRVISFHDVFPGRDSPFPGRLAWLAGRCRVVSLADAYARRELDPERLNVVLTFDDGYAEHEGFAAPALRELGLPATFFVPSGAVGLSGEAAARFAANGLRRSSRPFTFMSEEALRRLAADPLFEVGGHTRHHIDLGSVDDDALLAAEIGFDRNELERLTGTAPRWFAFPFGGAHHTSPLATSAIREAGYEAAFTIMPGYWARADDPLLLGRDSLAFDAGERAWTDALRGGYDAVAWLKWRAERVRRRRDRRAVFA